MAIGSSHFWVRRLESSILLLKKYPEFLNIPTILGRYHYNIYSMMDLSYQEIYHNLPLKLRQNWMLWDTRICNSWINGWPHFTFIYTVLIYIYIHTPYAPCMEYLPTFTRTKSPSFVGKYTIHGAYGLEQNHGDFPSFVFHFFTEKCGRKWWTSWSWGLIHCCLAQLGIPGFFFEEYRNIYTMWGPRSIAKLVNKSPSF